MQKEGKAHFIVDLGDLIGFGYNVGTGTKTAVNGFFSPYTCR
jgi:hypothetical protein